VVHSDLDFLARHKEVWDARPELRSIYEEWFAQLSRSVDGLRPIVEIGSGPGFFKGYCPSLIATDIVVSGQNLDLITDACSLPFRSRTVGALVMVDALHHLPKPLQFISEAERVLKPGGRLAMIEPWITPPSYLLYRFFHREQCSLKIDLNEPFESTEKKAFDGNAAIPYKLLRHFEGNTSVLRVVQKHPFIGLPYLATFGFQVKRQIPQAVIEAARVCERILSPLRWCLATRIFVLLERKSDLVTD
jgi:SAM-dependent methyltransferase